MAKRVVFAELRIFSLFSYLLRALYLVMFRRLFPPLSVTCLLLTCSQCATTEKEKPTPASQRALHLERADPLLLDTTALGAATASAVASNPEADLPKSGADYRVTIRATDALLASTPADVRALLLRAKARSHLKEYTAAITDLNLAVRFAPTSADAHYQRGLTRLKLKQYPAAIADFTKATQYNPQCKEAFFGRGAARMQTLNFKAALPDFTAALALDSAYADAYAYRGLSYASLNQPTAAKADLEKAIQLNPAAEKRLRRVVRW